MSRSSNVSSVANRSTAIGSSSSNVSKSVMSKLGNRESARKCSKCASRVVRCRGAVASSNRGNSAKDSVSSKSNNSSSASYGARCKDKANNKSNAKERAGRNLKTSNEGNNKNKDLAEGTTN